MKNKSVIENDLSNNPKTEINENKVEGIKVKQETLEETVRNENKFPSNTNAVKDSNALLQKETANNTVSIAIDLSEGEASSEFETVSSVNSQDNIEELGLSFPVDDEDFSVIVKIENELAYQYKKESSESTCHWNNVNNNPLRHEKRINNCVHDYTIKKHCGNRIFRDQKYREGNLENKNNKYDRKYLTERGDLNQNRKRSSYNNKRYLSSRSDCDRLSKQNRSSEQSNRYSSEGRFRCSRSLERKHKSRSPNYKSTPKKTRRRKSESFDQNTSDSSLKSNPKKKIRRPCSKSVWDRLDRRSSSDRLNTENRCTPNSFRKKERTPFLVELEKKLKELEHLRNSKKVNTSVPMEPPDASKNKSVVPPEIPQTVNHNPNPPHQPKFIPSLPTLPRFAFPLQCTSFPTVSMDNLPLVRGPTGLPVHVTVTGEQIPYDIEGRRIPVGPNGYYLPLDPTGRLFAHIVSPANQAVPIHMTSDGVLRLPNSEPVPYGPGHKLPVSIDGTVIFIGPDSRPLYPCINLPREPPLQLLQMVNSAESGHVEPWTGNQMGRQEMRPTETREEQNPNQGVSQSPQKDVSLNSCLPVEKTNDCLNERGRRKRLFNADIGQNPGGPSSAMRDAKRAKTQNNSVVASDSGNLDCTSREKPTSETIKEAVTEEIVLISDEEQDLLVTVCGKKNSKTPKSNTKTTDLIKRRTQLAVKTLNMRNYKPPELGRFIVCVLKDFEVEKSPNESPLLRNRARLPFLTPNFHESNERHMVEEKPAVTFKFLPLRNSEKRENCDIRELPNPTSDVAVQCDITSDELEKLKLKVTELEMEVVSLKSSNSDLLERYRNLKIKTEERGEELRKALSEVRVKREEIQNLRCLTERWD